MKTNYTLTGIALGLIICINLQAQYYVKRKVTGDFRIGLNMTEIDIKNGNMYKKPKFGGNLTFWVNYSLIGDFCVQSGISITKKGIRKSQVGYETDVADGQTIYIDRTETIDANYLLVPLNVGLEKQLTQDISVNLFVGGYLSYGIKGYRNVKGYRLYTFNDLQNREDLTQATLSTFRDGYLKRIDYGLDANASLVYDVYAVSLGFEHGLRNVSANQLYTMRNRSFYISAGFRF